MTEPPAGLRYVELLRRLVEETARLNDEVRELPVTVDATPEEIRAHLESEFDFAEPRETPDLLDDVTRTLLRWPLHVIHPRYFGLFNPTPDPVTVAADALVSALNPQLAVWAHAPAANEMEAHALRFLTRAVGYDPTASHASFTSGGQASNHTAVVAALSGIFPVVASRGLRSLDRDPVLYVSRAGHHSMEKAAAATGLGREALVRVAVDDEERMDPDVLRRRIRTDRAAGKAPFLVVATAGTTGTGAVDPLPGIADVAEEESVWLHVDAAWGGSALLSPRLRAALEGIERADSVTWDAHKGLWTPFATGMFFSRRPEAVRAPFTLRAGYVPESPEGATDRLDTTLQWSRRFAGLRVFAVLARLGRDGVARRIERQAEIGDVLRARLRESGWVVLNRTRLPVVCFTHPRIESGSLDADDVVRRVCRAGRVWISAVDAGRGRRALRACVTSYLTDEEDVEALVEEVEAAGGRPA